MVSLFAYILLMLLSAAIIILLRTAYILLRIYQRRKQALDVIPKTEIKTIKTMVIMGSGGHTAEMLRLLGGLQGGLYFPREYVVANTDTMSVKKIGTFEESRNQNATKFNIHTIPRSREVGQSWFSTFLTTFYACLYAIQMVMRIFPDLVLCNGPGTCIPLCGAAFLMKVLGLKDSKIIYVESICRVKSLSLSGKMLYWFADHVLVQWPSLVDCYPQTKFIGRLS